MKPDVVDTAEIAWRFGVQAATVHRWRQRFDDFPPPDYDLAMGPAWLWQSVKKWGEKTGRQTRWEKEKSNGRD